MWQEREIAPSEGEIDPPEEEMDEEWHARCLEELVLRDQWQETSSYIS
jgi:hypothetical protein